MQKITSEGRKKIMTMEQDLPFTDEPFDKEAAEEQEKYLEEHFDEWLESLRD